MLNGGGRIDRIGKAGIGIGQPTQGHQQRCDQSDDAIDANDYEPPTGHPCGKAETQNRGCNQWVHHPPRL